MAYAAFQFEDIDLSILQKRIGERVRAIREEKDISITDLSAKTGIGPSHIACMEIGTRGITLPHLYALAKALHVSTDYLLGLVEKAESDKYDPDALSARIGYSLRNNEGSNSRAVDNVMHLFKHVVNAPSFPDLLVTLDRYIKTPPLTQDDFDSEYEYERYRRSVDMYVINGMGSEMPLSETDYLYARLKNAFERTCAEIRKKKRYKSHYLQHVKARLYRDR